LESPCTFSDLLGIANSRMKDFYDLWVIARQFEFEGPLLSQAIRATFARRRTAVPAAVPVTLSSEFVQDRAKQTQWRAFIAKSRLDTGGAGLEEVVDALRTFLMPLAEAVAHGRLLDITWPAAGPWLRREPDSTG